MQQHPRLRAAIVAAVTGGALALAPTAFGASSQPDRPTPQRALEAVQLAPVLGTAVHDRYIVAFEKDSKSPQMRSARADAKALGARVTHTYSTALDGFAAELPAQALRALRRNPNVAFIEPDRQMRISETQSPATWGIDRIDQRNLPLNNAYTFNQSGAGVTAYILDTGIRASHSEFSGRVTSGFTSINDGRGTSDCNGHGTHVAGTVGGETYGVAQDVRLVPVRVLDCQGSGSYSGIIAGIDWVTQQHTAGSPAVANMSLGGGASSAIDAAVNNSIADGVTYAIAAGNESGSNACNVSPARVGAALTVGSTTSSDARSSFSNIGSCLDIFAPGSSITSAWHTSNIATNTISGTSMATPHVAGAAALYLQTNPSASPATVANALIGASTPNKVTNAGSGSPNRLLHTGTGSTNPDPDPEPEPTTCDAMPIRESGSLSSGGWRYHPGSSGYYYSGAGTQRGCLAGPSGADFDLYLEKWNGSRWAVVARSISATSQESVSYNGSAGYYSWRVSSYSGSGSYTFGLARP